MKKHLTQRHTFTDSSGKQTKLQNRQMKFDTCNIRSLYRSGFLMIVSKELSKYVRLLEGQEIRCDEGNSEAAGERI
jgi:hypothetical protein